MSIILLKPGEAREHDLKRAVAYLGALPDDKTYSLELKERKNTRSLEQNAYLWGVCYPTILEQGGEALGGWRSDDLHEYFLGEWSGWETLEGFGRKRLRPIHRSSKLSTSQFSEFVAFIQMKAAELGIYIPDPNEMRAAS